MGNKKGSGKWTMSSGTRREGRLNRNIKRLKMKVNRWNRYQSEIEAGKRSGPVTRWDTSGLLKQIQILEKAECKGIKLRKSTKRSA